MEHSRSHIDPIKVQLLYPVERITHTQEGNNGHDDTNGMEEEEIKVEGMGYERPYRDLPSGHLYDDEKETRKKLDEQTETDGKWQATQSMCTASINTGWRGRE